ncbi:ion transporter [Psychromonas sp. L1A2]|uniref:ion transporter n=1 Tax=Psychromonas sp. L1A2 TaxID=2686356 RepID=UPI00135970A2|nr:ion transporter [Psychromonas sp. L1A2]
MLSKNRIRLILEGDDSTYGVAFMLSIQLLIVLSLVTFSLETLPNLSASYREILNLIELFTVVVFTIEYLLRVITAKRKLKFVFSFYGIVDLCAIVPFYIIGLDLRTIRIFRFLRLIRILKLFRYNQALKRFRDALLSVKEELILFGFIVLILLYLSAVGIYYFENAAQPELFKSIFHCLWWAVTTLTTVGYGDMYPITAGGKIFTFVILTIGLAVIAVPTGLFASALAQDRAVNEK